MKFADVWISDPDLFGVLEMREEQILV